MEGTAFIVTVAAIALWAEPLVDALGVDAVKRALGFALPLTLALQWALMTRHLGRPSGLAGLVERRGALALTAVVLVAVPAALLGPAGALAGLLTVTWTGGSILIRRGWAAGYCAVVAAAVPAMLARRTGTRRRGGRRRDHGCDGDLGPDDHRRGPQWSRAAGAGRSAPG